MLQIIQYRRDYGSHVRGKQKTEDLKAASPSECSGKETQRLGSGLHFYIIVNMLGTLVSTLPTHFPQASFFPTVQ